MACTEVVLLCTHVERACVQIHRACTRLCVGVQRWRQLHVDARRRDRLRCQLHQRVGRVCCPLACAPRVMLVVVVCETYPVMLR